MLWKVMLTTPLLIGMVELHFEGQDSASEISKLSCLGSYIQEVETPGL